MTAAVSWNYRIQPDNKSQVAKINAERIRAMTNEELAQWIIQLQMRDITAEWCNASECKAQQENDEPFDCTDAMLRACGVRWLNQAVGDCSSLVLHGEVEGMV